MRGFALASLILMASGTVAVSAPLAFHRLSEAEIRQTIISHEFTDETHWFFRFKRDGRIEGASMGRNVRQAWTLEAGKLCTLEAGKEKDCREVWRSGAHIEMRRYADDPVPHSGILRP